MILLYNKTQQVITYGKGLKGIRYGDERPFDILLSVREIINADSYQDSESLAKYITEDLFPALRRNLNERV